MREWIKVPRFACSLAIVLPVVCGLSGFSSGGLPDLNGVAMLECSGLPCIDVTIASGKHLKMLIDTGNVQSIVDEASAKTLGLEIKPYVGRDGKPRPDIQTALLSRMKIGSRELLDVKVLVTDLGTDIRKGTMPDADGTLAYTAFGSRMLRLDYKHHRVEFSDVLTKSVPCPQDCGTLTTPTFGSAGPPIVVTTGFSVNGSPVTVQIDTLYSGTMLIYPTSVEKLSLAAEQSSKSMRVFSFTDGGVRMIEATAKTEGFANKVLVRNHPLYFATPEVHAPDGMFDGTVGHELFAGHILTLDFYSNHFWLS